jgi:putative ATP-binding cassette transporter
MAQVFPEPSATATAASAAAASTSHPAPRHFRRDLWRLVRPFFASEERGRAWLLLGVVVVLALAMVFMEVQFNAWNGRFYNALETKDTKQFLPLMGQFGGLAAVYIAMAIYRVYLQQALQIRWRRWLTDRYLTRWLADRTYYRLQWESQASDNPDQRIAEDVNLFIERTLSLGLGLLSATVTLLSFLGILWALSGGLEFTWNGETWEVYGYMVWVALVYAIAGTALTHWIGKPLIGLAFHQQRTEADFRFQLARFREHTEAVALYRGEAGELAGFRARFTALRDNWWAIMKRTKLLNTFTIGYNQVSIIFPFLAAGPRYFAGQITLGTLMQTANAFGQVQGSLSWFINAYQTFADWKATVDRLVTFEHAIAATQTRAAAEPGIVPEPASTAAVEMRDVTLALPDGRLLQRGLSTTIARGERVLVRGASGSGKSTFFRLLAGLWPYARGRLALPAAFDALFLPQRPYFPIGALRAAVAYPATAERFGDDAIREALVAVGMGERADQLGVIGHWSQQLSGGEQQRVAIARALLHRPQWLFLDEGTSNLDPASEAAMFEVLRARLPDTTLVSISHTPELERFHTRVFELPARAQPA